MSTSAVPTLGSREKLVTITVDPGGLVVSPDPFRVSKQDKHEVHWVCSPPSEHFTVDFGNDSPFYESQFSDEYPYSGPVRRDVLPGPKIYEYTVWAGNKKLDPGGGVDK
jgi:hypothetical protein